MGRQEIMKSQNDCQRLLVGALDDIYGDDTEMKKIVEQEILSAKSFVDRQSWCKSVRNIYVGKGVPGKFMSFFIEIEPASEEIPKEHWIICGDIPTGYICTDDNENAYWAIASYILVMDDWVDAVRRGRPIDDCYPVDVPSTREWADRLAGRLEFMRACLALDADVPKDVQAYLDKHRRFFDK